MLLTEAHNHWCCSVLLVLLNKRHQTHQVQLLLVCSYGPLRGFRKVHSMG